MADPTRARILLSLLDGPGYPGDLSRELGLTRSNVSNHLSCLRGCGIVAVIPEGRSTRYEIADAHVLLDEPAKDIGEEHERDRLRNHVADGCGGELLELV